MSLSFLLILFTYTVVAAACIRANSGFSAGLINTLTLGIVLFAGIMGWSHGRKRPFWIGFFIFFTGLQLMYLWTVRGYVMKYTLANALGDFINSTMSSTPFVLEPIFRTQEWYSHISNCFIASAFGIIGGLLTTKVLRQESDRAQPARRANNAPDP